MEIGVLGALEVRRDGVAVPVAGGRVRALLARLALDAGRDVARDALIDAVWAESPPGDAVHALQALVSRLRRALGDAALVRSGPLGYALAVAPEDLDAARFETAARAGAAALARSEHGAARDLLGAGLALWRGAALAEFASSHPFARDAGDRLDALRLAATADRIEADLALGADPGSLVAELDALTAGHPLNERLAAHRLRALAAAGRPADALGAYEALRRRLDDELGAVPSAGLVAAHLAVLASADAGAGSAPTAADAGSPPPAGGDGSAVGGLSASPPAAAPRRTNLRFGVTSFVGREDELDRLDTLISRHRLVTLIGPGGAGKTRLASEAAARQAGAHPDGVWMVELAQVTDPAGVGAAVLGALGLREARTVAGTSNRPGGMPDLPTDALTHLLDVLAERAAVIVLDNCEHLIDGAAAVADELLGHCPGLRVVATSREPLGIAGEHLAEVPPLGLPAPGASPEEALAHPAVQLFADRAAAVAPGFAVDAASAGAVVEICRRLDGLPLAIELAAARLRTLPVDVVAARLDDRFRLLTGGSRTALPRQRTLRAVVDWSWELLSPAEEVLARRLAVFPAGVTPESAAAVAIDDAFDDADLPDLLAALVDRSLLTRPDPSGPVRYRMLETLREYGIERLEAAGELGAVRTAHAHHFAALATDADRHLRTVDQLPWYRLVRAERDNVLAALRWLAESGEGGAALGLAVDLLWYWMLAGSPNDALSTLTLGLEAGRGGGAGRLDELIAETVTWIAAPKPDDVLETRARAILEEVAPLDLSARPLAMAALPLLAWATSNEDLADELFAIAGAHPDPWVRATVPLAHAQRAENVGDLDGMARHFAEALEAFTPIGERWGLSSCLSGLAGVELLHGDLDGASSSLERAVEILTELDADADHAIVDLRLADVRYRQGRPEEALAHARRAIGASDLGSTEAAIIGGGLARMLWCLGHEVEARRALDGALATIARLDDWGPTRGHVRAMVNATAAAIETDAGDLPGARARLEEAIEAGVATDDLPIVAMVGLSLARYVAELGEPQAAARLLGASARLRGSADRTHRDIASLEARLVAALGQDGFDRAFEDGRALEREEAAALVAGGLEP